MKSLNKAFDLIVTKGPIYTKDLIKYSVPKAKTFWNYAKIEMRPPKSNEFPKIQQQLEAMKANFKQGKWKNLTVRQAWLNGLVGMEIMFWFFAGEIIGRRSFLGYNV